MDDSQLQSLITNAHGTADRLAIEGRYVDAAMIMGLIQAVRALRTKLEPPAPVEKPALVSVPEGG